MYKVAYYITVHHGSLFDLIVFFVLSLLFLGFFTTLCTVSLLSFKKPVAMECEYFAIVFRDSTFKSSFSFVFFKFSTNTWCCGLLCSWLNPYNLIVTLFNEKISYCSVDFQHICGHSDSNNILVAGLHIYNFNESCFLFILKILIRRKGF